MEELGLGVGLAALAFWGFVAAVSVGGIWNGIRKRDAQHETIRRLVESGQPLDQELMEKLSLTSDQPNNRPDQDFYITALWLLPVSVGLGVFALILGASVPDAKAPLLGVSALTACLGVGWLIAAKIAGRWYKEGNSAE
jgi:hypothetical protein